MIIPNIWGKLGKKCSKAPTSHCKYPWCNILHPSAPWCRPAVPWPSGIAKTASRRRRVAAAPARHPGTVFHPGLPLEIHVEIKKHWRKSLGNDVLNGTCPK
jgi:hypothetical protein